MFLGLEVLERQLIPLNIKLLNTIVIADQIKVETAFSNKVTLKKMFRYCRLNLLRRKAWTSTLMIILKSSSVRLGRKVVLQVVTKPSLIVFLEMELKPSHNF
jgi:hypothetical protein